MNKTCFSSNVISRSLVCAVLLLTAASSLAQERSFQVWLQDLRSEAVERGYSEASIEAAFSEIEAPVQRIVTSDRNQPERVQTYADYIAARVSEWRARNGRIRLQERADLLREVAEEYGVQPRFIVAIWGMETNFGTYPIPEPAFSALATLAFDQRRGEFFRSQFFSALDILDSGFPGYEQMKSSWAGAMGQTQFLPENYLRYAVDFDGDGNKDIWNSEADVLASIANYLASFGWTDDRTWGRRVQLPVDGEQELFAAREDDLNPTRHCQRYRNIGVWRDLQDWQTMGVRRSDGSDLPSRSIPAALLQADPGDGEGFIVYSNFCAIMAFNPALKYALSIGLLSDLIAE